MQNEVFIALLVNMSVSLKEVTLTWLNSQFIKIK